MVEPRNKKVKKVTESDRPNRRDDDKKRNSWENIALSFNLPVEDLEIIHSRLKSKCLCPLLLSDILHTLSLCNDAFPLLQYISIPAVRQGALLYLGMLSLFFEVSVNQHNKGILCTRISEVAMAGAENEAAVIDLLFDFMSVDDKMVSYAACRAISALLIMLHDKAAEHVLERLVDNIALSENFIEVGHSIEAVRKVIEWKDIAEHPLEEVENGNPQHTECEKVLLNVAQSQGSNEVKYITTKTLDSKWFVLVPRITNLISEFSFDKEYVIVAFLTMWESLLSVKANLSVTDTKEFYSGLERLMNPLSRHSHVIIWRKVMDLYNEVLCYGSTLALQDILAEEPCNLAHLIIRAVKDRQLLDCVPLGAPAHSSTSGSSSSACSLNSALSRDQSSHVSVFCHQSEDPMLLHKVVLVTLKAVAITVKETKSDSSSENSSRSGGSGSEDNDMIIIERSLREVIRKLDDFVKSRLPFHPEAPIAEWMVKIFADQDDWLVESMICGLDIYTGLGIRMRHPQLHASFNPHSTFLVFLELLYFDHDVLLDLLVSNETSFLLYLLHYLKLVRRSFTEFTSHCGRKADQVMSVFIRLRLAIDRLVSKSLFPYNINPILRLLERCEELYEEL